MKKFSKIITILLAITMLLSNARLLRAEDGPTTTPTPGDDSKYEPQKGETINFTKYLISELGHVVPDLSFTYTIEGGDAIPALPPRATEAWEFDGTYYDTEQDAIDAAHAAVTNNGDPSQGIAPTEWYYGGETFTAEDKAFEKAEKDKIYHKVVQPEDARFEVFKGIDADKVVISTASFSDTAPDKYAVVQGSDSVILEKYEVYQKQIVSVDFSAVKFEEPGIYRYKLTEDVLLDERNISYDTQCGSEAEKRVRYIDVYVIDNPNATDPNAPALIVDKTTVMHEVATEVLFTDEMGSKDEKATVPTAWELPELPDQFKTAYASYIHNPYAVYDTAESDRALLSKTIHDDIVNINDNVLPGLRDDVTTAEAALTPAERDDLNDKEIAMNNALDALNTAKGQLDPLYEQLKILTDPVEINAKRTEINAKKAEIGDTTPATGLTKAYNDAKDAYDTVYASVKTKLDAITDAKEALQVKIDEMTALQDLFVMYEPGCIFEVTWELSDKSHSFVNELTPEIDLQFHKKVDGNQGSRDKYFKFTVTVEGLDPNELVYVEGDWTAEPSKTAATKYKAEKMKEANTLPNTQYWMYKLVLYETEAKANEAAYKDITSNSEITDPEPATEWYFRGKTYSTRDAAEAAARACCKQTEAKTHLIADSTGKIEHDFYLKHDEYIKLLDMKYGATYTVTEVEEDYLKTPGTDKKAYKETSTEVVELDKAIALIQAEINNPSTTPERKDELLIEKEKLETERTTMLSREHKDPTSGTLGDDILVPGSETWTYNETTYKSEEEAGEAAKGSVTGNDTDGYTFPGATQTYTERKAAEDDAIATIIYDADYIRGANVFTGYTNTRNGIIPTGVMAAAGTGALIVGAGILGLVAMNRRREEDDEEE